MALRFRPVYYMPQAWEVSEIEHVEGMWVHPNVIDTTRGYAKDELIVAIAGKVSWNGGYEHGAGGVYFGPGNDDWNQHLHFNEGPKTAQGTEIWAALQAIERVRTIRMAPKLFGPLFTIEGVSGLDLDRLIIKSDSDFLAEAMTVYGLHTLKSLGWSTSDGVLVESRDAIEALVKKVEELMRLGVQVLFWHVSEEDNAEAHEIADMAHMLEPNCICE